MEGTAPQKGSVPLNRSRPRRGQDSHDTRKTGVFVMPMHACDGGWVYQDGPSGVQALFHDSITTMEMTMEHEHGGIRALWLDAWIRQPFAWTTPVLSSSDFLQRHLWASRSPNDAHSFDAARTHFLGGNFLLPRQSGYSWLLHVASSTTQQPTITIIPSFDRRVPSMRYYYISGPFSLGQDDKHPLKHRTWIWTRGNLTQNNTKITKKEERGQRFW